MTQILNKTEKLIEVPIILANGKKDSVNIQPRSRVNLPTGSTVNPDKLKLVLTVAKIVEQEKKPTETVPTQSSTDE